MSKAIVNALTLALATEQGVDITAAKGFAERFVADNAELFAAPAPRPAPSGAALATAFGGNVPAPANAAAAIPMAGVSVGGLPIAAMNQQQLKEAQTAGYIAQGLRLCPNCQQPSTDHLPGCTRANEFDMKAVTKSPLPPVG